MSMSPTVSNSKNVLVKFFRTLRLRKILRQGAWALYHAYQRQLFNVYMGQYNNTERFQVAETTGEFVSIMEARLCPLMRKAARMVLVWSNIVLWQPSDSTVKLLKADVELWWLPSSPTRMSLLERLTQPHRLPFRLPFTVDVGGRINNVDLTVTYASLREERRVAAAQHMETVLSGRVRVHIGDDTWSAPAVNPLGPQGRGVVMPIVLHPAVESTSYVTRIKRRRPALVGDACAEGVLGEYVPQRKRCCIESDGTLNEYVPELRKLWTAPSEMKLVAGVKSDLLMTDVTGELRRRHWFTKIAV